MSQVLVVGDKVRFNDRYGSIGEVVEVVPPDERWKFTTYKVQWTYGMDINGKPNKSTSRYQLAEQLVKIPEELFQEYSTCRAWTPEARAIHKRIFEATEPAASSTGEGH